ncbi:hypothetical protein, partial [Cysteiniphilum sp. 6C5]|uniref:hypothetical protein n=1 Tax=unclassified Cysteiniphilum TaxID=2610889 RepID=UPI003F839C2E
INLAKVNIFKDKFSKSQHILDGTAVLLLFTCLDTNDRYTQAMSSANEIVPNQSAAKLPLPQLASNGILGKDQR